MKAELLKIKDVCKFVGGSQPEKTEFISEPRQGYVRLIQIRDYKTDSFRTFVPEGSVRRFCSKFDIMIGRYGPPIFQIFRGIDGAYNVALLKAEPFDNIDREYLYYFLKQDAVFEYIDKLSSRTGGQTGVDLVSLYEYPIHLPLKNHQEKLSTVLVFLDKKIEINNRINAELEAMAKTLYDYWFVQFDFPDENGKPYKSSGGKMLYSKELKREIPAEWEIQSLTTWIANDKSGDWGQESLQGNFTKKVTCIRGADINGLNGKAQLTPPVRYILSKNKQKLLVNHDLIIEISGGSPSQSTGRLAYITNETLQRFDGSIICSNFCKAISLKNQDAFFTFVYLWNRLYDVGAFFGWEGKTSGIKNLLFDSFTNSHKVEMPPDDLHKAFYKVLQPMEAKKQKILQENQRLAALRDWLLPMLMNGQVRVESAV